MLLQKQNKPSLCDCHGNGMVPSKWDTLNAHEYILIKNSDTSNPKKGTIKTVCIPANTTKMLAMLTHLLLQERIQGIFKTATTTGEKPETIWIEKSATFSNQSKTTAGNPEFSWNIKNTFTTVEPGKINTKFGHLTGCKI